MDVEGKTFHAYSIPNMIDNLETVTVRESESSVKSLEAYLTGNG